MFSKKELVYLALTIFIVSLSIAFDDGSTSFSWAYWLNNFIVVIIIVALSFFVTLLSNGQLFFLAVGQYTLLLKKASRFGRKFVEVTNYEEAKIALAGPMANIILMILGMLFNSYGTFDTFILINAMLALFHMLPLPGLAGTKIYFGSRLLYVSSLVFMVSMTILAYTVSVIPMLLISLASLFISGSLYYYYTYFKG